MEIARLRFNFPTDEHRDHTTYLNLPQNTMGIRMPGGLVAYPDIKGNEVLDLCRKLDLPYVGIRSRRYIVGYDEIEINDHHTV